MKPTVGIYRLQLFKPSETFIGNQVKHFRTYDHVFIGRKRFGPEPYPSRIVTPLLSLREMAQFVLFRDPRYHLKALAGRSLDLIHAHFAVDGVYALPLSRKMGIPLVTTFHGFDVASPDLALLKFGRPAPINAVLKRKALQEAGARFLCVSQFIRRAALKKGFPEERMALHYVGIDTDAIEARAGAGEAGLIVHVARLVEVKGTAYLLRALQILKTKQVDARLLVIGDGPLRADLERLAKALGIENRVTFAGMVPNVETLAWIKRAALVVVPSVMTKSGIAEAFGMVNLEAAASAVPVVAFNSGGVGEAVIGGKTGILLPERDIVAMAAAVEALLADPSRRIDMGLEARRNAETNFNIKLQTAKLEGIYDEVRGEQSRVSRPA